MSKRLSVDRLNSCGKKIPCLERLEDANGHQSLFCKIGIKKLQEDYEFNDFSSYSKIVSGIWTRFLCHFQNGALHFCTSKTDRVIKQNVNFNSIYPEFRKNCFGELRYLSFWVQAIKP